jgi:hypothetical protein
MARITKALRENMLKTLSNHGFEKAHVEAYKTMLAVGDKVYADVYAEHLAAIESLPNNFFHRRREFKIVCGGQYFQVEFGNAKPIPYNHDIYSGNGAVAKIYDAGNELIAEYESAFEALREVKRARTAAKDQASAVLESVTTFKQLWQVWPDCRPILESFDQESKTYPVSIPVQSLNAAFGLPVGEVAA